MVYRAGIAAINLAAIISAALPAQAEENKLFPAEAAIPNSRNSSGGGETAI